MKTILICHDGCPLDQVAMVRWLASFSTLSGLIVLRERKRDLWRRIRREFRRSGLLGFVDVVAFRLYYAAFLSRRDQQWQAQQIAQICKQYPPAPGDLPILYTHSPNTTEVKSFIEGLRPDIMVARCKTLLRKEIFALASKGTFVFHPGICPQYRNAHGCFWALVNRDLENVGMSLLRIDKGVDTGPVYGYFSYPFDEGKESHFVIQSRVVFENLDPLRVKLLEIYRGEADPLDTAHRVSASWGQPWLTSYIKWKAQARRHEVGVSRA